MQVEQIGKRYIARSSFAEKHVVKSAGFRWDPNAKVWYTTDAAIAARIADPEAAAAYRAEVEKRNQERAAIVEASRASDLDIQIPCPDGLAYLPYQRAGINYSLRRPRVLFGDEMGLGKTIQAIGLINADETIKRVLVICPASLKLNWARELRKWLTREFKIGFAEGKICRPEYCDILICNYDIAHKHAEALRAGKWDLLICDEAHYLKNHEAKRTQAIVGKEGRKGVDPIPGIPARRAAFLTGTPIPNRPIEGWSIFHYLDPQEFNSFFGYAKRFCDGQQNGYGWDFSGASHLDELQEKLRASIMVRRLKKDVLTELPAKRRSVIEIAANGDSDTVEAEREAWERNEDAMAVMRAAVELSKASDNPEDYNESVARLKHAAQAAFTEMARLRHDTAVATIPYLIEHVRNAIEGGKVIVFAHHHDVLKALDKEFSVEAVSVHGEIPIPERQAAVDAFQNDPHVKVFIGGIQAAGVGLTLTAASHVVFGELDWVPGNMTQAEDRCHRIGQTDSVLVEHLVLEGSISARMAHTLVAKQAILDAALDREKEPEQIVLPSAERERGATENTRRAQIEEAAAKLSEEDIARIHRDLQILAARCDGARQLDGAGFNRIDSQLGKSLAERPYLTPKQAALGAKLTHKYRRQLVTPDNDEAGL